MISFKFLIVGFQLKRRTVPRPKLKIKKSELKISRACRDGQDLAALVKSARRTNAVRHIRRVALRAFVQLRQFQHTVVSAALTLPAR
jgi:hypothetical protein